MNHAKLTVFVLVLVLLTIVKRAESNHEHINGVNQVISKLRTLLDLKIKITKLLAETLRNHEHEKQKEDSVKNGFSRFSISIAKKKTF